jgi:SAM-dependent methyltransferase
MNAGSALLKFVNHRLPWLKVLLPRRFKGYVLVNFFGSGKEFDPPPSRKWLEQEVLPKMVSLGFRCILFVGAAPYTWHYERIVMRFGGAWVTCDANPSASVWGAHEHVVAPIQQIDGRFSRDTFDAVILNGVFGFGVDSEFEMNRSIVAVTKILRPGGLLLLGWNTGLTPDPLNLDQMRLEFAPASLFTARRRFANETHVYDFQIRQPANVGHAPDASIDAV